MNALTKSDWALVLIAWVAAVLVGALVMEHAFGMAPCALCLMQQAWFMLAGLVVLIGLLDHPERGIYPLLTLLSALAGAGFAVRHIWIGTLPADAVPACVADIETLIEWGMWEKVLTAMTVGTGDCAEADLILGVPLAVWALGGFIVIGAGAVMQWLAPSRR